MDVDLPNGAYLLPGDIRDCWQTYQFVLYVHDGKGGLTNVWKEDAKELRRRLSLSQDQIAKEVQSRYRQQHTLNFVNEPNLAKLIEKLKEQHKMAKPKFKDGWYRVDGEIGDPKGQRTRINSDGTVMNGGGKHHYLVGVKGGEIKCLLPMGNYEGEKTQEQVSAQVGAYLDSPGQYGENYIKVCEKAWGVKNIVELVPELQTTSTAVKATGAGLLLLFAGSLLGRMAKNRAKAEALEKQKADAEVSR